MSAISREQFTITGEAELAMARYGIPNPVDAAMEFDIDVDAMRAQVSSLRDAEQTLSAARSALPQGPPDTWGGASATAWDQCVVTFWDVILKLVEKGPKIILTIVAAAAWLIANFGKYIDQFLDWMREGLESYRESIAGCLGTGPDIDDEPIGRAPLP